MCVNKNKIIINNKKQILNLNFDFSFLYLKSTYQMILNYNFKCLFIFHKYLLLFFFLNYHHFSNDCYYYLKKKKTIIKLCHLFSTS